MNEEVENNDKKRHFIKNPDWETLDEAIRNHANFSSIVRDWLISAFSSRVYLENKTIVINESDIYFIISCVQENGALPTIQKDWLLSFIQDRIFKNIVSNDEVTNNIREKREQQKQSQEETSKTSTDTSADTSADTNTDKKSKDSNKTKATKAVGETKFKEEQE